MSMMLVDMITDLLDKNNLNCFDKEELYKYQNYLYQLWIDPKYVCSIIYPEDKKKMTIYSLMGYFFINKNNYDLDKAITLSNKMTKIDDNNTLYAYLILFKLCNTTTIYTYGKYKDMINAFYKKYNENINVLIDLKNKNELTPELEITCKIFNLILEICSDYISKYYFSEEYLAYRYALLSIKLGNKKMAHVYIVRSKYIKNKSQIIGHYLTAIENGITTVYFEFAEYLYKHMGFSMAEEYYLKAIEQGDVEAMTAAGNIYITYDVEKGLMYLNKAVESGSIDACKGLANYYSISKNYDEMVKYYLKAKNLGCIYSIEKLADYYLMIAKDYEKGKFYSIMYANKKI